MRESLPGLEPEPEAAWWLIVGVSISHLPGSPAVLNPNYTPPSSKGSIEAEWNEDGLEGGQQQDPKDFPSIILLNPPNRGLNESPPFYRREN